MASLTGVSPEQGVNSGILDFIFHVARGGFGRFTWQRSWGLQAENPCFGIIVHILAEVAG